MVVHVGPRRARRGDPSILTIGTCSGAFAACRAPYVLATRPPFQDTACPPRGGGRKTLEPLIWRPAEGQKNICGRYFIGG